MEGWRFKASLSDIMSSKPALDTGDPASKEQLVHTHPSIPLPPPSCALYLFSKASVITSAHMNLEGESDLFKSPRQAQMSEFQTHFKKKVSGAGEIKQIKRWSHKQQDQNSDP